MKPHYLLLSLVFSLVLLGGVSHVVRAEDVANKDTTQLTQKFQPLENPLKVSSVEGLLFTIVDFAIFLGAIIAVLLFVFIGFKFVMAQGEPKALDDAKTWFKNAVIGTAILLGSKIIVEVIKNTVVSAGIVDQKAFNKQ